MSERDGQRVVCVDASSPTFGTWPLVQGRIYTVRRVLAGDRHWFGMVRGHGVHLDLVEAVNPTRVAGFWHTRFRTIDERHLDPFRANLSSERERLECERF